MSIEIWTFRVEVVEPRPGAAQLPDLSGYAVEASDGEVGEVTDVRYERDRAFLAVDTGPWIFGRTVLLPAGLIARIDDEARTVHVDRTKDEIKDAPPLALEDRTPEDEERLGRYYGGA